jgi:superfamily II DNA or RNA helicase
MKESNLYLTEKEIVSRGTTLDEVITDLTLPNPEYENFVRFGHGRFYKKIEKYICYLTKEEDKYVLPRYYFGEPDKLSWTGEKLSTVRFNKKLRDYQETFINDNLDDINRSTGILIEASCGSGKTVIALYIALMRGVKTMILVPTYYLANQWKERIEEFTDCTSVVVTSTDKEIQTDNDFTIIVMDTFSVRILPKELIKNIGHVILDEAHRVGAETYLPILNEIPAKFRTALTATFRRADGVHKILKYHFGHYMKMDSRFPPAKVYTIPTGIEVRGAVNRKFVTQKVLDYLEFKNVSVNFTESFCEFKPPKNYEDDLIKDLNDRVITKSVYFEIRRALSKAEKLQYTTVESYLTENSKRRKVLTKVVKESLDKGRTVLFLSKRKDTLKAMYKIFGKYKPILVISETNKMNETDRKFLQNDCKLILGVMQLAKEGLDIDRLDTLILDLPLKDTEQAIGRILRQHPDKKEPICIYPLDECPLSYAVFNNAKKFIKINATYEGNVYLSGIKSINNIL